MDEKTKVEEILKKSRKPLDQEEIAKKTGIEFWEVVDITNNLERRGLITAQ